jgi:hypothetical protein
MFGLGMFICAVILAMFAVCESDNKWYYRAAFFEIIAVIIMGSSLLASVINYTKALP